jgi:PAS domain S-box-containing protein
LRVQIFLREEALHQENGIIDSQRLATSVEGSNDAIFSKTAEGIDNSRFIGVARVFGYTAQEIVGQPIACIVPFQSEKREVLNELRLDDRIDTFDTIRLAKIGNEIPVSATMFILRVAALGDRRKRSKRKRRQCPHILLGA